MFRCKPENLKGIEMPDRCGTVRNCRRWFKNDIIIINTMVEDIEKLIQKLVNIPHDFNHNNKSVFTLLMSLPIINIMKELMTMLLLQF